MWISCQPVHCAVAGQLIEAQTSSLAHLLHLLVSCDTSTVTISASAPHCSNSLAARDAVMHLYSRQHKPTAITDQLTMQVALDQHMLMHKHAVVLKRFEQVACCDSVCSAQGSMSASPNHMPNGPAPCACLCACCCVIPHTTHGGTRLGCWRVIYQAPPCYVRHLQTTGT